MQYYSDAQHYLDPLLALRFRKNSAGVRDEAWRFLSSDNPFEALAALKLIHKMARTLNAEEVRQLDQRLTSFFKGIRQNEIDALLRAVSQEG